MAREWRDTREPLVALREDEGQPDDRRLAETHALPMAMREAVVVQEGGHTHFLAVYDNGWNVVYAFVDGGDFWAHPTSVTPCSFSHKSSRERSVYIMLQNPILSQSWSLAPAERLPAAVRRYAGHGSGNLSPSSRAWPSESLLCLG